MSDQWYYGQNGTQKGPVSIEVMQQLVAGGHLKPDDLVWKEGMANWVAAGGISEMFARQNVPPVNQPTNPTQPANPTQPTQTTFGPAGNTLGYEVRPPNAAALQSKATTALVLGICSIVPGSCLCGLIGVGLGVGAIILSKQATGASNEGAAKAGFVCGIVGIALSAIGMVGGVGMHFIR